MVLQVIRAFFSAESDAGGKDLVGKTNKKFSILILGLHLAHIAMDILLVTLTWHSISMDMKFNRHVIQKELRILEHNRHILAGIYGNQEWRQKLCRVSHEQLTFFVGTCSLGAIYIVDALHFLIYPSFRIRVIWPGIFHVIVLFFQCLLMVYLLQSYLSINDQTIGLTNRIAGFFEGTKLVQKGHAVSSYNSLIVPGTKKPVFHYCFNDPPSDELNRRIKDGSLCPANHHKRFALVVSLLNILISMGLILGVFMWHCSAQETQAYGEANLQETEHGSESSSSDSTSLTPEMSRLLPSKELEEYAALKKARAYRRSRSLSRISFTELERRRSRRQSSGPQFRRPSFNINLSDL